MRKSQKHFMLINADDIEITELPSELLILRTMFEFLESVLFGDIVEKLKTISVQERVIINKVITIKTILLTTGAASATSERSLTLGKTS